MSQQNQKKEAKISIHSVVEQIKQFSQNGLHSIIKFGKIYTPKLKALIILSWHKLVVLIQIYGPKLKNVIVSFVQTYGPKLKNATVSFAHIYGRKFKEAFIAFRKNYEPKIKEQANILGSKTIDFANELKKKINKS